MAWLLDTVERYKVAGEAEALEMREDFSHDPCYDLESFSYVIKYDKKADEEYAVVKVKKVVNKEKECNSTAMVRISTGGDRVADY